MTPLAVDAETAARVGVLVLFGLVGVWALRDVGREHGYGAGVLLFGIYLATIWIAVRP